MQVAHYLEAPIDLAARALRSSLFPRVVATRGRWLFEPGAWELADYAWRQLYYAAPRGLCRDILQPHDLPIELQLLHTPRIAHDLILQAATEEGDGGLSLTLRAENIFYSCTAATAVAHVPALNLQFTFDCCNPPPPIHRVLACFTALTALTLTCLNAEGPACYEDHVVRVLAAVVPVLRRLPALERLDMAALPLTQPACVAEAAPLCARLKHLTYAVTRECHLAHTAPLLQPALHSLAVQAGALTFMSETSVFFRRLAVLARLTALALSNGLVRCEPAECAAAAAALPALTSLRHLSVPDALAAGAALPTTLRQLNVFAACRGTAAAPELGNSAALVCLSVQSRGLDAAVVDSWQRLLDCSSTAVQLRELCIDLRCTMPLHAAASAPMSVALPELRMLAQLQQLSLCLCGFDNVTGFDADAIAALPELQGITMCSSLYSRCAAGVSRLRRQLSSLHALRSLSLSTTLDYSGGCALGGVVASQLPPHLCSLTAPHSLFLPDAGTGSVDSLTSITRLQLTARYETPEAAAHALVDTFPALQQLRWLRLDYFRAPRGGDVAFLSALRQLTALTYLDMNVWHLDSEAAAAFETVAQSLTCLRHVWLPGAFMQQAARTLACTLSHLSRTTFLHVTAFDQPRNARLFATGLKTLTQLRELHWELGAPQLKAARVIARLLPRLVALTYLSVDYTCKELQGSSDGEYDDFEDSDPDEDEDSSDGEESDDGDNAGADQLIVSDAQLEEHAQEMFCAAGGATAAPGPAEPLADAAQAAAVPQSCGAAASETTQAVAIIEGEDGQQSSAATPRATAQPLATTGGVAEGDAAQLGVMQQVAGSQSASDVDPEMRQLYDLLNSIQDGFERAARRQQGCVVFKLDWS